MVVGWLAPLASGLVTYGLVWVSGMAPFRQGWHWGPERLVGVCLERSVEMVVALLAILVAWLSGTRFVSDMSNAASLAMALATGVALLCYTTILFIT